MFWAVKTFAKRYFFLDFSLTQEAFVDSVQQDQTAQNVHSDLHCPHFYPELFLHL